MKKTVLFISAFIMCVVIVVSLLPSEKGRIKNVLVKSREAVVAEDIDAFMDHISFNYRDDSGGSYVKVRQITESVFGAYDDFDLSVDVMNITVDEDRAEALIKVSAVASNNEARGYVLGSAGGPQDIRVYFGKDPYEWKITGTEYVSGTAGRTFID